MYNNLSIGYTIIFLIKTDFLLNIWIKADLFKSGKKPPINYLVILLIN